MSIYGKGNIDGTISVGKVYYGGNTMYVVDELPEASESLHGRMAILRGVDDDRLYVCLKVNYTYDWVPLTSASTAELNEAILNSMKLK